MKKVHAPISSHWIVYMVRCANGSLYTGITNNLAARIADHNAGKGAKYTAAFGPVELVWKKRKKDRSAASVLEAAIKKLTRKEKDALIGKRGTGYFLI
ncbi:MAG TPA: endonuclease [Elusimicrobia bacterium]|nr:endonuclease [Elusimicrobiota bacterium]